MKKYVSTLLCLIFFVVPYAYSSDIVVQETLEWSLEPEPFDFFSGPCARYRFKGGVFGETYPDLPYYIKHVELPGRGQATVQLLDVQYESFEKRACPGNEVLEELPKVQVVVRAERGQYFASLSFVPIVRRGERFERIRSFTLKVNYQPAATEIAFRGPQNTLRSVLADGQIYKIAVRESGVYRLSQSFLRSLGINTDNVDPRKISIYGNGGGMLSFFGNADRPDDLIENHIVVVGEEDGRFDANDYVLFYAQGPDRWIYNAAAQKFEMEKNLFDTRNYYFIKIGTQNGARAANQASLSTGGVTINSFDDYARFEDDRRNLLHDWQPKASGSGLHWYSDVIFRVQRQRTFSNLFSLPNLITSEPVKLDVQMALRAGRNSRFFIEVAGQTFQSAEASRVTMSGLAETLDNYARVVQLNATPTLNSSNVQLTLSYPFPSGATDDSEGWLDWIQINARRALIMTGRQMPFRSIASAAQPFSVFELEGASARIRVWDITDPLRPKVQSTTLSGSKLSFSLATQGQLREFIAFDNEEGFLAPEAIGRIGNQNYHGIDNVDMVILYHPDFSAEAAQLAEHRRSYSGLSVALVRIDSLYNEFASGKQDPTAIRDFAKMLFERNNRFRYLLLFGDATFDYRNIYNLGGNFIPTFQRESLNPLNAHPSDDYFGLFSNLSPTNPLQGNMDIAVGRLTVSNAVQAAAVVRKIIHYDTSPATYGDWRNRMVFVADDEDSNTHLRDCNQVADLVSSLHPNFNIDKIYLDAYPQQSTSGGTFIPEVNAAINRAMFKGILALTYFGHGGPRGLAQERVVTISDILSWCNFDNMPLLVTATCTFAGFDDPTFVSAGEEAFLNAQGGAIALYSTTRAVFANYNRELSQEALLQLFNRQNGGLPTIGEAMRRAKNALSNDSGLVSNSRKFSLIGDPALKLKVPEYQVVTTNIDAVPVTDNSMDTIRGLQRVTIEGAVLDNGQVMSNFNGEVIPTIFDKPLRLSTLGQDAGSFPFPFSVFRSILFRGRASVNNGIFRFTFVVPKDIDYRFGMGKASYYAFDPARNLDAAGHYNRLVVGGTRDGAFTDTRGPEIEVFINSENFVFGSIVSPSPVVVVRLSDESGINVTGNSIGHDLEAVLDDNTQNTLLLNDFYESDLDDYTKGRARYPLFNLPEGRHKLQVKAWDAANNSGEGYTEFVVANAAEVALQRVLNYPNPFTDFTCFQFDHNLAGQEMDVMVQIFTVSGRLVKTLEQRLVSDGAIRLHDCIQWDGRDDFGDRLARGVYLYQVRVRTTAPGSTVLKGESKFEKLVILK